jgi:myo-inositol 2-dehydrogenase/D-chiro-inositol 1-dehydrogenase
MTITSRLRVGIAGLGRLGRRHADNLARRIPRAELIAACSPVQDELAWAGKELGVTALYADFREFLADAQVDAVFLVTPTSLHAEQIVQALQAGKHVFCEKPLSLELGDCLRVEELAAKHPRLKVMIGYGRRFDPSYRDAYDKVRAGTIGKPFLVRSQNLDMNDPSGFFVRFAPTSGGIFLDCTVHDIDLARWLLGDPRPLRVFATGVVALHEGLREFGDVDNGVATCEFADGQRVRNECTPTFYERFEEAFLIEAIHFVDAVLDDHAPELTLHDATEATRIALALRESLKTRRVIEL